MKDGYALERATQIIHPFIFTIKGFECEKLLSCLQYINIYILLLNFKSGLHSKQNEKMGLCPKGLHNLETQGKPQQGALY